MIVVVKAGSLTTVQDLGRPGLAHLGVPPSGAVDTHSLVRANRLVGNPDSAAALEMTLIGAQLRCEIATRVALCGAPMPIALDQRPVPFDSMVEVAAGQHIRIGAATRGVRAYLAVAGGIDVAPVLASRSTDLLSGVGPAIVKDGDRLPVGDAVGAGEAPPPPLEIEDETVLRIRPGPRDDWFTPAALRTLCTTTYTVSPHSNRIGLRLDGAALERQVHEELPSEGLVTGAVQVPADGRPLIFLADHPTTGGYPVIAVVEQADLPHAAQARPGGRVRFVVSAM